MLSNKVEKPHFKLNICSWNIAFAGIVAFPIILFKKILHDKYTASFDIDTIGIFFLLIIYTINIVINIINNIIIYKLKIYIY